MLIFKAKFICYLQSVLNISQDHRVYTFLSTTGQVIIGINSQWWDVDTMDCGGSHNFSLTSTSEYFTVYFFYPDLSNLEFNQVTDFLKLVFSWDCKEVHLYLVFGCLFSEMVLPLGLLGTLVLLINYKIPETTGYSFIHVFVHVILNLMLFLV